MAEPGSPAPELKDGDSTLFSKPSGTNGPHFCVCQIPQTLAVHANSNPSEGSLGVPCYCSLCALGLRVVTGYMCTHSAAPGGWLSVIVQCFMGPLP